MSRNKKFPFKIYNPGPWYPSQDSAYSDAQPWEDDAGAGPNAGPQKRHVSKKRPASAAGLDDTIAFDKVQRPLPSAQRRTEMIAIVKI